MANSKPSFSKLNLKMNEEVAEVKFNDVVVEVKQYLPVQDKLNLISTVVTSAHDENNFSNPVKLRVFLDLEIIKAYTNLTFTEKQLEDPAKLYDVLESNGVIDVLLGAIPEEEYETIVSDTVETAEAFYNYLNSMVGMVESISKNYGQDLQNIKELEEEVADSESLTFLKDVMNKMG